MIKTVSEMEFFTDFAWVDANIFNSYLEGARLTGFFADGRPAGLMIVKYHKTHLEIVGIYHNLAGREALLESCYGELLDDVSLLSAELSLPVSFSKLPNLRFSLYEWEKDL